jgi:hypothetical protein
MALLKSGELTPRLLTAGVASGQVSLCAEHPVRAGILEVRTLAVLARRFAKITPAKRSPLKYSSRIMGRTPLIQPVAAACVRLCVDSDGRVSAL